jgi:hypothetical protein
MYVDQVQIDTVVNGQPQGPVRDRLAQIDYDPGFLRPVIMEDTGQRGCWIDPRTGETETRMITNAEGKQESKKVLKRTFVPLQTLINSGMVPATFNSSALPYQAWLKIDQAVIKATRDRLAAWNDLTAANEFGGFNGMAVTGLAKETMTDPGDAKVDMETLSDDFNDAPLFTPDILPLPIIHAGFKIPQRRLATSRAAGMALDTSNAESSGRRCAETLEKMTIGTVDFSALVIGQSVQQFSADVFTRQGIYGFRTQPDRITKTDVTASASFVPSTFVTEVIAMKELARAQKFNGPFVLYYSTTWDQYLARDYYNLVVSGSETGVATPTGTVLQRVEQIKGISRVATLDFFTSTDELLLVQMNSDTVRAVNGMDWTTVQWAEPGTEELRFRVMGIKVPDLRAQYVGTSTSSRKCGIVHGTTS